GKDYAPLKVIGPLKAAFFRSPCRISRVSSVIVETQRGDFMMARAIAIIVARIIFSFVFFMAAGFKFADIAATAGYITAAGFPMATFLARGAAFFERAL